MTTLLVAPCSYEAAKYAVTHWHYSHNIPTAKMARFGAWEDDAFVGAVVFGRGGNNRLLDPYGLRQNEGCELIRVALREHQSPVTQIVARAIRLLRQASPGLQLIVSFADPGQGHHGGIYQAGNWLYLGRSDPEMEFIVQGKRLHGRSVRHLYSRYGPRREDESPLEWLRRHIDPEAQPLRVPGKHRYVYPLTKTLRRQLSELAKPYPAPEQTSDVSL